MFSPINNLFTAKIPTINAKQVPVVDGSLYALYVDDDQHGQVIRWPVKLLTSTNKFLVEVESAWARVCAARLYERILLHVLFFVFYFSQDVELSYIKKQCLEEQFAFGQIPLVPQAQ